MVLTVNENITTFQFFPTLFDNFFFIALIASLGLKKTNSVVIYSDISGYLLDEQLEFVSIAI